MGMKIYLLRHAESETNELGIRSSSSEDSLTDLGIVQSKPLRSSLGRADDYHVSSKI